MKQITDNLDKAKNIKSDNFKGKYCNIKKNYNWMVP